MRVPRKAALLTVAAAAACVAVSACATTQMGAAAITGNSRITSATLISEVANLSAAYQADQAKGISPQLPVGQETQQVLSWLIRFQITDEIASQQHIYVTQADVGRQLNTLSGLAKQSGVTVPEYLSAGNAVPPDLTQQVGQYLAIISTLQSRLNGGKAPTTQAEQNKVQLGVVHAQCLASKTLGVRVNPQYGQFDYTNYSVVLTPSMLAANPTPSKPAVVTLTPPC
jgi:LysM repeat protein